MNVKMQKQEISTAQLRQSHHFVSTKDKDIQSKRRSEIENMLIHKLMNKGPK